MFFPIGDDNVHGGHKPVFSYGFIGLNILVFLLQAQMPEAQLGSFIEGFGSIPEEISRGQDLYTLVSCMFLHGGWMHLIGNMVFLWVFADNLEAIIGSGRFLAFYLLAGIVATLAHVFFQMDSPIPVVGASGAIAAVLGAYIVMFPHSRIRVLFLLFFSSFYLPAYLFLGIWIIQQLFNGVAALQPGAAGAGVAWWAHIGGFTFGLLCGIWFRQRFGRYYL